MIIEAEITNAREVSQRLREIADEKLKEHVRAAVGKGADIVRDEAKRLAPVKTGRLRDSIISRVSRRGISGVVIADYPENAAEHKKKTRKQAIGGKEYYAFAVEYGTRRTPAQPFMRPAMLNKSEEVGRLIMDALEEATK